MKVGVLTGSFSIIALLLVITLAGATSGAATDNMPVGQITDGDNTIDIRNIGPGLPPPGWVPDMNRPVPDATTDSIAGVPILNWSYGCSPTAATMIFGYYDRNGYDDLYTGPTDGGVFPLTNVVWGGSTVEPGQGECPLTASHQGYDNRTTKGQVDDYYYGFGSRNDPYLNNWTPHSGDSVADFMGTSMYQCWTTTDGSTYFFYLQSGAPLNDYTGSEEMGFRDGMHGMRLFAESRGYTVTASYNQYIRGYGTNPELGFTYSQYKDEIDSGFPVIIQVAGHSMTGVGYMDTDKVIIHDTWDHTWHVMPWGGSYSGMEHYGVGVFHLAPQPPSGPPAASFSATPVNGSGPLTVYFSDTSTGLASAWNWSFGDGSPNSTAKNPVHTYTRAGNFTVNLTVSNAIGSSFSTMPDYVRVGMWLKFILPETGKRGTNVTIRKLKGSGFPDGVTVFIKNDGRKVFMKNITVVNPTRITGAIPVPAGAATGPWNVVVRNPDGTKARLAKGFTVSA